MRDIDPRARRGAAVGAPWRGLVVLGVTLSGCAAAWDAASTPPLEAYTDTLLRQSGAPTRRVACGMFSGTRAGWCRVAGEDAALERLVTGLGMSERPPETRYGDTTCLAFEGFSAPVSSAPETPRGHAPGSSLRLFTPQAPLPPNTDNVTLRRVYLGAGEACLELEYPYG